MRHSDGCEQELPVTHFSDSFDKTYLGDNICLCRSVDCSRIGHVHADDPESEIYFPGSSHLRCGPMGSHLMFETDVMVLHVGFDLRHLITSEARRPRSRPEANPIPFFLRSGKSYRLRGRFHCR